MANAGLVLGYSAGNPVIYSKLLYDTAMPMKLISNRALREFAALHPDADRPLQDFRRLIERGTYSSFAQLRTTFASVDKVGEFHVFNIGGNKYRLIAWIHFGRQRLFVKSVLTHGDYDKGDWK